MHSQIQAYSFIDPVLKQRWGALCIATAQLVKEIADDSPNVTAEMQELISNALDIQESLAEDAALLPDWICRSSLDILCGNLHTLGKTLVNDFHVTPAITASHVRYIVETAALVKFLSDNDPVLRVARAADTLTKKMKSEDADQHPLLLETYRNYSDIAQRFKSQRPRQKVAIDSYTEFVEKQLKDFGGKELYRALSAYTHHNAFIAYSHFFKASLNPTVMEADALEFVAVAVRCAITVGAMTTAFRSEDNRQEHTDNMFEAEDCLRTLLAETFPESQPTEGQSNF